MGFGSFLLFYTSLNNKIAFLFLLIRLPLYSPCHFAAEGGSSCFDPCLCESADGEVVNWQCEI